MLSKEFVAQLSGENQILYSAEGMTQSPTWEIVEYFLKNTFASLSSDPQNTTLALTLLVDVVLGTCFPTPPLPSSCHPPRSFHLIALPWARWPLLNQSIDDQSDSTPSSFLLLFPSFSSTLFPVSDFFL